MPDKKNDLQARIEAMRAKKNGTQPAGAAEAPKKPAAVAEKAKAPEQVKNPAAIEPKASGKQETPWYRPGCKACAGNDILGLNADGSIPCKICAVFAPKEGRRPPEDFEWVVGEDGSLMVVDGATGEEVVSAAPAKESTAKEVIAEEEPPVEDEQAAEELTEEEPPVEEEQGTVTASAGAVYAGGGQSGTVFEDVDLITQRSKFSLVIGCAVTEGATTGGGKFGSPVRRVTGEEVLAIVESEMCKLLTPSKWRGMNSFDKKDTVHMYGEDIAGMLGKSRVVITIMPRGSLLEAIVCGIRPYAGEVIQALQS